MPEYYAKFIGENHIGITPLKKGEIYQIMNIEEEYYYYLYKEIDGKIYSDNIAKSECMLCDKDGNPIEVTEPMVFTETIQQMVWRMCDQKNFHHMDWEPLDEIVPDVLQICEEYHKKKTEVENEDAVSVLKHLWDDTKGFEYGTLGFSLDTQNKVRKALGLPQKGISN